MGVNSRYKGTCTSNAALVNKYIGTAYDHVKNVSDNIDDVKTVADALGEDFPGDGLDTLVENIDDVVTVATNIDEVVTVAGIKDEIVTVAGIEQEIIDVPSYTAQAIDAANAAEQDAERAETEADRATEQADLAANIADPYKGLWPDVGGSADKGDMYQIQVGGVGTGQYFEALQDTLVDPVGDDVNWREIVSVSLVANSDSLSLGGLIVSNHVEPGYLLSGVSYIDLAGGDFPLITRFPLRRKDFENSPVTGVIDSINLSTRPYSITVDGEEIWLENITELHKPYRGYPVTAMWAEGDNSTPDDASIQACLNFRGHIHMPRGRYATFNPLYVRSFTKLTGESSSTTLEEGHEDSTQIRYKNPTFQDSCIIIEDTGSNVRPAEITFEDFAVRNDSGLVAKEANGLWLGSSQVFVRELTMKRVRFVNFFNSIFLTHAWMSNFEEVTCISTDDGNQGIRIDRGTSNTLTNCYVFRHKVGYRIFTEYSSMRSCAADFVQDICYEVHSGVTLYSCGAEHIFGCLLSSVGRDFNDDTPVVVHKLNATSFRIGSVIYRNENGSETGSAKFYDCEFQCGNGDGVDYENYQSLVPYILRGSSFYTKTLQFIDSYIINRSLTGRTTKWPIYNNESLADLGTNGKYVSVAYGASPKSLWSGQLTLRSSEKLAAFKIPVNKWVAFNTQKIPSGTTGGQGRYINDAKIIVNDQGSAYSSWLNTFDADSEVRVYTVDGDLNSAYLILKVSQNADNNIRAEFYDSQVIPVLVSDVLDVPNTQLIINSPV